MTTLAKKLVTIDKMLVMMIIIVMKINMMMVVTMIVMMMAPRDLSASNPGGQSGRPGTGA